MKKGGKSGTSEEDRALWQHVAKSVRAYDKAKSAAPKKSGKAPAAGKMAPPETPAAKTGIKAVPPARRLSPAPAALPPADDGTARSLRQKKWPIDKTLDLHGMSEAAAHQALTRLVGAAARYEWRTLLVITGKGSRLAGGGVLRRALPLWLEQEPLRARVLAAVPARPEDGGDGAFYIRLRKPKAPRR